MLQEIIDRLKSDALALADVYPAENIDALMKGTAPRSGTAFVLPYRERGEPNTRASGGFRQKIAVQYLVAFVIRQHDDAKGGKKASMFDEFKSSIEHALAGWEPPSAASMLELVSAQSAPLGNSTTIYVQTWETSRYLKGNT
ncbi:phage tail terminator protein [Brucella pseudogrignonensis]|uniref:phage tail terminator protein n=1 Tax=Brucella pseudogrignonensis TaxID=419475 RepID=UPI003ECD8C70